MAGPQTQTTTQYREQYNDPLLDRVLQATQRLRSEISSSLTDQSKKLERMLPDNMKGQGERLCQRAMFYFDRAKSDMLRQCTPDSFVNCVLCAAELGFAIDGRMAYAVPYRSGNRVEAQFQVSYIGMLAVAKRSNLLIDCYGRIICKNDVFRVIEGSKEEFYFERAKLGTDRGDVIGAFACVTLPNGQKSYDIMDRKELDGIQNRSKAKDSGPWQTDPDQMRIKTVMKRKLKLFADDPGIARLLDLDDDNDADSDKSVTVVKQSKANAMLSTTEDNGEPTPVIPLDEAEEAPEQAPPPKPTSARGVFQEYERSGKSATDQQQLMDLSDSASKDDRIGPQQKKTLARLFTEIADRLSQANDEPSSNELFDTQRQEGTGQ